MVEHSLVCLGVILGLQMLALLGAHLAGLVAVHQPQVLGVAVVLAGTLVLVALVEAVALQQMEELVLAAAEAAGHMAAHPTLRALAVELDFSESDQTVLVVLEREQTDSLELAGLAAHLAQPPQALHQRHQLVVSMAAAVVVLS